MTTTRHSDPKITFKGILTAFAILSAISGGIATVAGIVLYVAPLRTLPTEVGSLKTDINSIGRVQAVQAESLKTLAEIAVDTKQMRRDVDDHTTQIEVIKQRVTHLEKHP